MYVCRYIGLYESHMNLLNGSASAELDVFLKEEQDLAYLGKVQYTHSRQHSLMSCCALHVCMWHGAVVAGAVQPARALCCGGLVSSKSAVLLMMYELSQNML